MSTSILFAVGPLLRSGPFARPIRKALSTGQKGESLPCPLLINPKPQRQQRSELRQYCIGVYP
jgi:hypothetical protein